MLSLTDSEKIGRACIRQATGFSGAILPGSVLKKVGVVDSDAREAVNDEIVNNSEIGVKKFGHKLGPSALTFTPDSHFFELRDEISAKATAAVKKGGAK